MRRPIHLLLSALLLGVPACSSVDDPGRERDLDLLPDKENVASLYLDGDDDYVELDEVGLEDPLQLAGEPFTVAAWFKQEAGGDPSQRIVDKSDGPLARNGWALAADPESGMIHFYVHDGETGADFVSGRALYTPGEWHFVVAVARADRLEIWIDGDLDTESRYESGAHTLPMAAVTGMRIGTWNHSDGREWQGWLDEVAVWNTDLSPESIATLHSARGRADLAGRCGVYEQAGKLVGWWRMGSGTLLLADPTAVSWGVEDHACGARTGSFRPAHGPRLDVGEVP
jgi:hypothetical protein